jgi:uncharacterized membrane protein YcaP (DUF421 family)
MLAEVFSFRVDPLEIVVRGSAMYWFLFAMFRFVLRRDVKAVGIADVLLLVIVADASQNALAGAYESVPEGMLLVATLIFWNFMLDWGSFHFSWVRRFAEPRPLLLVHNGQVLRQNLRREFITVEELLAALRENGVDSPSQVAKAYMESDGNFSVVKRKPSDD